jgi:hypothetical protein
MSTDFSFKLNSCLQLVANMCSWPLSSWFGRRTIYLGGTFVNRYYTFPPRDMCVHSPEHSDQVRPSLPGYSHIFRLRRHHGTNLILHHRRDMSVRLRAFIQQLMQLRRVTKKTKSSLTILHTPEPHTRGIINVRRLSISGASTVIRSAK